MSVCLQIEVRLGKEGRPVRGTALKAVVAGIYSRGTYLSLKADRSSTASTTCRKRNLKSTVLDGIMEMRSAVMSSTGEGEVDDEVVLEAYGLADQYCLSEIAMNLERYIQQTYDVDNALARWKWARQAGYEGVSRQAADCMKVNLTKWKKDHPCIVDGILEIPELMRMIIM